MSDNSDNVFHHDVISKNKLQELNDLYMLIKKEKLKYLKNDIFLETIIESCHSSYGLSEVVGVKIKDIILRGEIVNCIQIKKDTTSRPETLLDDFNNIELSFADQKDLKIALERRIKEKGDLYLKELNDLIDSDLKSLEEIVEHIKFDSKLEQDNLLSLQKQLTEQQQIFVKSLAHHGEKLQELLELKTKTSIEVNDQKIAENRTNIEKYNLRQKILSMQIRLTIFEELPLSIDAYRKAINDLKEQQEECNKEIEKMRADIDNYQVISKNEEFQEILEEYKQYKRSVENKLWICNELNKTKM